MDSSPSVIARKVFNFVLRVLIFSEPSFYNSIILIFVNILGFEFIEGVFLEFEPPLE